MTSIQKCTLFVAILSGILISNVGCQPKATDEKKSAETSPNEKLPSAVTIVPTPKGDPVASPAIATNEALPLDLGPDEICRKFLERLQRSEHTAAEKLLSRQALVNTKKADLNLESPGSRQAKFKIEPPRYATNKLELATVDCTVTDFINGEMVESRLTWMLRKEPSGWRISGMILDSDDGKSVDLLSFESTIDVDRIKASLQGETSVAEIPQSPDSTRK